MDDEELYIEERPRMEFIEVFNNKKKNDFNSRFHGKLDIKNKFFPEKLVSQFKDNCKYIWFIVDEFVFMFNN
jgi:hypothetical protein